MTRPKTLSAVTFQGALNIIANSPAKVPLFKHIDYSPGSPVISPDTRLRKFLAEVETKCNQAADTSDEKPRWIQRDTIKALKRNAMLNTQNTLDNRWVYRITVNLNTMTSTLTAGANIHFYTSARLENETVYSGLQEDIGRNYLTRFLRHLITTSNPEEVKAQAGYVHLFLPLPDRHQPEHLLHWICHKLPKLFGKGSRFEDFYYAQQL